jgi:nitroimidazol reductase NimA-like FMN-containing flavoprotein (pyridoxamine 5'-phosphate oxidase superfamily)
LFDQVQFAVLSWWMLRAGRMASSGLCAPRSGVVLHGARDGRKVSAMQKNPWGCAVIIGDNEIIPEKLGRHYKTVIVEGAIELIDDPASKRQVMTWVVERKSPDYMDRGQRVIEKMLDRVLVYKMSMEIVSGKHGL